VLESLTIDRQLHAFAQTLLDEAQSQRLRAETSSIDPPHQRDLKQHARP
jgi:hypothetical protein